MTTSIAVVEINGCSKKMLPIRGQKNDVHNFLSLPSDISYELEEIQET
tara:strand:+ start:418 stop:561 length:144 start_codon:yes stop_codon:yes gene_type:complete